MSSKKKKEKKKEKRKKSAIQIEGKTNADQGEMKKSNIFSKIDMIDSEIKEESQVMEAKLRRGLIETEQIEKEEKLEEKQTNISEIKKKIEELRELKQKHYAEKDYEKAIEFSKIIINIAMKNKLKLIIIEEKEFIAELENEKSSKVLLRNQIENLKKKRSYHYNNEEFEEAIQIALKIINLAEQLNLKSIKREEEKFIDILQEKLYQETSQMIDFEKFEDISDINENNILTDAIKETIGIEIKRSEVKKKDKLEEEKQKFEEEKAKFNQEKLEYEEAKKAFDWEKKMFEEAKQFEREKMKDEINQKTNLEFEIKEKEKFRQEKIEFEKEREKFYQERQKFEETKVIFYREKQQFEEEKKAFYWEKEMFEEAKQFEKEKK
ncbi:MAG: hypothetical protein ACFFHD_06280 [Promethearchaeota archaeon]